MGALLLCGLGSVSAAGIPLSVRIKRRPPSPRQENPLPGRLPINRPNPCMCCAGETPLDGLSRSLFDVSCKANRCAMDKLVHWGHPESKDFVKIARARP